MYYIYIYDILHKLKKHIYGIISHWHMFSEESNNILIWFLQYALADHCSAQNDQVDYIEYAHLWRHCYPLVLSYWLIGTVNLFNVQGVILSQF